MSPKFQVYKDAAHKTRFRIRADNKRIVAVGEAYEKYPSCLKGIESVKRNCQAGIEDLTVEGGPKLPNPKYQIFKDNKGKFRFHLKAANGEVIAQSEGYESKEGCLNGIDVLRRCANAEVEDPFAIEAPVSESQVESKIEEPRPQPPVATPVLPVEKEPAIQLPVEKPKVPLPEIETEKTEAIPIGPALTEEKEIIEEAGPVDTTLELHNAPDNIGKGDKITFQGRLYSKKTGRGIANCKIHIWERDRSILGDDYLAYGYTGQDGSFSIPWKARSLAWRKDTGNIYAKFMGNERAKPSQSTIQEIAIR